MYSADKAPMKWKVVSTNFGKLELALNRLSDEGFGIWKLVILSPESTRTKRFVVIVIGRKSLQEEIEQIEEIDETVVTVFGNERSDPDQSLDKNLSDKPWQGKLVDPEFRPDRRTGRFNVKDPFT